MLSTKAYAKISFGKLTANRDDRPRRRLRTDLAAASATRSLLLLQLAYRTQGRRVHDDDDDEHQLKYETPDYKSPRHSHSR